MLLVQPKCLNTTNCCIMIHNTILRHVLYLILAFTHSTFSIHISTTLEGRRGPLPCSLPTPHIVDCATHWHTPNLSDFLSLFSLSVIVLSQTQLLFAVVCYLFLRLTNKESLMQASLV